MPISSEKAGGDGVFDIFLIGPMQGTVGSTASSHLPNLELAVRKVMDEFGLPSTRYEIQIPQRLAGAAIVNDVFARLDMADFAIADISTRGPNVFYEIAILQALGTPLVLIDLAGKELPFYWGQQRVTRVRNFRPTTLSAQLKRIFEAYFDPAVETDLIASPISAFYGVPLVDISAAQGLAAGYFENFVEPVLTRRVGALAENRDAVTDLKILRPHTIDDRGRDWNQVVGRVQESPDVDYELEITLSCSAHKRGAVRTVTVGNSIVDLPTALYTLHESPRYRRLYKGLSKTHMGREQMEIKLQKMKSQLISAFFTSLDELIDSRPNLDTDHYSIVEIDAFVP